MSRRVLAVLLFAFVTASALLLSPAPANAQTTPTLTLSDLNLILYWYKSSIPLRMDDTTLFTRAREAKAQVDECYFGLDDPNWEANLDTNWAKGFATFQASYPGDFNDAKKAACISAGGHLKTNQAYVWGLTEGRPGELWFGTVGNTLCLVLNGFYSNLLPPTQNNSWGCQMMSANRPYGDARPPRIYRYNTSSKVLTEMTGLAFADSAARLRLSTTMGLRSAGSKDGVVILAGVGSGNVTAFAYDADNYTFLGSYTFDGKNGHYGPYNNIRQWITFNGELYTGVAQPGGPGDIAGSSHGQILRWTGSKANPFSFEIVGNVDGDPAYLSVHDGSMYSSTWGGPSGSGGMVISKSPAFTGRLTNADATGWTNVWKLSNYEVEPTALQAGGAIASYGGWLYFSTMHVPATGAVAFYTVYGDINLSAFLGSYRPIMIFRGKNFGTPQQQVQLLYGNQTLPKYDPVKKKWNLVPNGLGQKPLYGGAGFGNFFNNYTWWMQVYKGELFVGTMDWSYLASTLSADPGFSSFLPSMISSMANDNKGADLWHFMTPGSMAIPASSYGVGNNTNYGIRTMIVTNNGNDLYLGSANPMNLLTDPNQPLGGWELIRLTRNF